MSKEPTLIFLYIFASIVVASSVRLLTAIACELDPDLRFFEIEQAFVPPDLEENVLMCLPQGSGELSG